MSVASTLLPSEERRIGLRRSDFKGVTSLHGKHLEKEQPAVRQPSPDEEDINRPPDSSDDDSIMSDGSFADEPASKRRKRSGSEDSLAMGSRSRLSPSSSRGILSNARSNKQHTVFPTSQNKNVDDDEEPFSSFGQASQPKRSRNKYGARISNNIHTEQPKPEAKRMLKQPPVKLRQDAKGFKTRDMTSCEARLSGDGKSNNCQSVFKNPPEIGLSSPRVKRHPQRSTGRSGDEVSKGYNIHDGSSSAGDSPIKSQKIMPQFKTRQIPEFIAPQLQKTAERSLQPLALDATDEIATSDMEGLLQKVKTKSFLPFKAAPPSTTESSLLSTSNEAGSSSSLSSPPSSPRSDASIYEIHDLTGDKAKNYEPTQAFCPVCKAVVDRSFLEEFNNGQILRARQQTQFCTAHKIRAAEQKWTRKGYPSIDWDHFDRRLEQYHPFIEEILAGRKTSYYRNAFEDRLRKGQMKALKATLLSSESMEGVVPGYYGSRGARAIIENLTSSFAPRIRRLGSHDWVISTAGVPPYIQLVLAPEMAVQLVMDDMKVDEDGARAIIRDSVEIGNLLNVEQDEMIHVIESEDEELYG